MPYYKTKKESHQAYRLRQRGNKPPKQTSKSASERMREYRARRKTLLNAAASESIQSSAIPTVEAELSPTIEAPTRDDARSIGTINVNQNCTKMVDETQKKLQTEIDLYKQIQKDYHKALVKRQQLDGQLNENAAVKEELDLLKSGNEVFKLIGPVLIKQDLVEAKQNVAKRMEYISNELKRTEDLISDLDKKQEVHRETLDKLQQVFQQAQLKASKKP